jgi:SAM-dependent methyltransferase
MSPSVRRRADCRLCGGRELELVLKLAPTPPANAFVPAGEAGTAQAVYPLDLHFCRACAHVQLLDVVDPAVLFENYVYVSGTSPVFVRHFESYAGELLKRAASAPDCLAVDIGSNDGILLSFFQTAGLRVLGIDPAKAIAADATKRGLETLNAFFTPGLAKRLRAERGPAAIVTANNVFAHADDLRGIAEGVRELLAPDGIFAFEVSYLLDVVEKTLFDTIYHEHVAYHSVNPLKLFLASAGLELFDAERVDTHGGSLRGFAQRAGGPRAATGAVERLIALDKKAGLDRAETFKNFAADIDARKDELSALLRSFKKQGKKVAGFGAPAKATTLMHHFALGADLLDFVIDDSPLKQGLLTPGLHIPVLPAQALYERKPDYALVLAWNFAPSIMAKHKAFSEAGGRFVVPLPRVEVH